VVEWWSGGVVEYWSVEVGVLGCWGSIANRLVVFTLTHEHSFRTVSVELNGPDGV
jgi:hypothetical protein